MLKKIGLIPSRLESSRLPEKALLDIAGTPMIVHVAKRAMMSSLLDEVIVCTDSLKIVHICINNDIRCMLTKAKHLNGTERIAEAAEYLNLNSNDIVIDIQGDEPLLAPKMIDNVVNFIQTTENDVVVPYIPISSFNDSPNRVKIIESMGRVHYMTRAPAPFSFLETGKLKKHLSIVGFRGDALFKFASNPQTPLERVEGVELLRALEIGLKVGTFEEVGETLAVDTYEDYLQVKRLMLRDPLHGKYQ
jgi:3-deoxy-manno-octulosonate cytidylyltransferase (CMP-KDO synthetase)